MDRASVYLGKNTTVGLRAKTTLNFVVPKLFENDLDVKINYKSPLKAPIVKGQEVGTVTISIPKGEVVEVPLVTTEAVESLGTFAKIIAKARLLTTGQGYFD